MKSKQLQFDLNRPQEADSNYEQGGKLLKAGRYEEAIGFFNKALDANPNFIGTYINRGNCYYQLKQYPKAIEDYQKAIELEPDQGIIYSNLGSAYFDFGDLRMACENWTVAQSLGYHGANGPLALYCK